MWGGALKRILSKIINISSYNDTGKTQYCSKYSCVIKENFLNIAGI